MQPARWPWSDYQCGLKDLVLIPLRRMRRLPKNSEMTPASPRTATAETLSEGYVQLMISFDGGLEQIQSCCVLVEQAFRPALRARYFAPWLQPVPTG